MIRNIRRLFPTIKGTKNPPVGDYVMADEELKAEGVFVLSTPADMVAKLQWEIENYTSTIYHQMKQPEAFRSAGYQAFNCAVTLGT
jgi:hypothetical protein